MHQHVVVKVTARTLKQTRAKHEQSCCTSSLSCANGKLAQAHISSACTVRHRPFLVCNMCLTGLSSSAIWQPQWVWKPEAWLTLHAGQPFDSNIKST
eukprot:1157969-Pelagomonas_calceolata.AAC.14